MKKTSSALSIPQVLILLAIYILPLMFFGINAAGSGELPYALIYGLYLLTLLFLMFKTGKISKYRRIFFVSMALLFFPAFIHDLIIERGTMLIPQSTVVNNENPFCHIVIPITMIPMILKKMVIFPGRLMGHYTSIYSMLVIWVFMTISLGRGWCSWVCFYGGWDDGCSRISQKTKLNMDNRAPWIRNLPKAMLLFVVLGSLITLTSIYCEWLCPFKLITEFESPTNLRNTVALILMIVLFFGTLIILPILSRRRVNCGLLCPFGAMQGLIGSKIAPFKVKMDKSLCISCGQCEKHCPSFSMGKNIRSSCTLCGECIDLCPTGALDIHLRGKKRIFPKAPAFFKELLQPRNLFILAAFTGGTIISYSFAIHSLKLLVNLFLGVQG